MAKTVDPLKLAELLWPDVKFYSAQRDIIYSVVENDETVVRAGHMLGKDFVAAFVILWFFLTRSPCRVVTTSADYSQLESVLWGELRRFIQTAKHPLDQDRGGSLICNHLHLKKIVSGQVCGLSYCIGRVAAKGEGMQGHHIAEVGDGIPRTLYVADEASGVDDLSYDAADSWARRKLIIGNPYPCANFFRRAVLGGDILAPTPQLPTPPSPPIPPSTPTSGRNIIEDAREGSKIATPLPNKGKKEGRVQHNSPSTPHDTPASSPQRSIPTPDPTYPASTALNTLTTGSADPPNSPAAQVGPHTPLTSGSTTAPNSPGTLSDPTTSGTSGGVWGLFSPENPPGAQGARYYRRVMRVRAEDSPNVRLALAQLRAGKEPTHAILVPGVLPYADYVKRRLLWDPVRQCIGLDGEFYEGAEILLFPPEWLNRAEAIYTTLNPARAATSIGVDPAEGGDKTTMCAVDNLGVVERTSKLTPDTNVIPGEVVAFMRRHGVKASSVFFDAGGGGTQAAHRLRAMGYPVRTVAFGEAATPPPRRGLVSMQELMTSKEEKYAYVNRRAELYGTLRLRLMPTGAGFGLPPDALELRRQLQIIPLLYDDEGRLRLPPKRRKRGSNEKSLEEMMGCSPDEADALVLAVWGLNARRRSKAGTMW